MTETERKGARKTGVKGESQSPQSVNQKDETETKQDLRKGKTQDKPYWKSREEITRPCTKQGARPHAKQVMRTATESK